MIRQAADNVYLHKDFHSALNFALIYLEKQQGEAGVRQYLDQFAGKFYKLLNEAIRKDGLDPLEEYLRKIYEIEGGQVKISRPEKEILLLEVTVCPAAEHIRQSGNDLAPLFYLTHAVVHSSICRGTPYQAEFSGYVPATGGYVQRFSRRENL